MKSRYALLLAFVLTLVIQDAGAQKLKRIKKTINAGLYAKALRMIDTIDQPKEEEQEALQYYSCLLYTSPSPRDRQKSRMPSSA